MLKNIQSYVDSPHSSLLSCPLNSNFIFWEAIESIIGTFLHPLFTPMTRKCCFYVLSYSATECIKRSSCEKMASPQLRYPPKCNKSKSLEVHNWLRGLQGGKVYFLQMSLNDIIHPKIYRYMYKMFLRDRKKLYILCWSYG